MLLNPALWIVHTRGGNTNEAWLIKKQDKGSEFSELTRVVFVAHLGEYVTRLLFSGLTMNSCQFYTRCTTASCYFLSSHTHMGVHCLSSHVCVLEVAVSAKNSYVSHSRFIGWWKDQNWNLLFPPCPFSKGCAFCGCLEAESVLESTRAWGQETGIPVLWVVAPLTWPGPIPFLLQRQFCSCGKNPKQKIFKVS